MGAAHALLIPTPHARRGTVVTYRVPTVFPALMNHVWRELTSVSLIGPVVRLERYVAPWSHDNSLETHSESGD